jgi:hypothetical protein
MVEYSRSNLIFAPPEKAIGGILADGGFQGAVLFEKPSHLVALQ